jgi:hypothetical protein
LRRWLALMPRAIGAAWGWSFAVTDIMGLWPFGQAEGGMRRSDCAIMRIGFTQPMTCGDARSLSLSAPLLADSAKVS